MNKKLEHSFEEIIRRKDKQVALSKTIPMKDIGRKGQHTFICEAYTHLQQHNNEEKHFFFERLKRVKITGKTSNSKLKENDIEYRISYYIVGKNGTKKDRWIFGQFCPLIPPIDFEKLINKARREKVILK
ncbi:hypothetical protein [Asinibacterium sp. OR53]|uniref:hypothetical protein n=1 Tax=Asinibacterium sp. OR53 TaxID=925409 RepID=UPI00047BC264|nr:hypothetical protein [Asinibacterium sp. OR53]